jgi:hypothetical protein
VEFPVIPAEAGIHFFDVDISKWAAAFAGATGPSCRASGPPFAQRTQAATRGLASVSPNSPVVEFPVIPAEAGILFFDVDISKWAPAFAGATGPSCRASVPPWAQRTQAATRGLATVSPNSP